MRPDNNQGHVQKKRRIARTKREEKSGYGHTDTMIIDIG
jgi:hypothetical protein